MADAKVIIFLGFFSYLFLLSLFFGFIGSYYGEDFGASSTSIGIGSSSFDIISGLSIIPAWATIMLIGIPFAITIILLIHFINPTTG